MHKFFYEVKPFVLIIVGALALLQNKDLTLNSFTLFGAILVVTGCMILIIRQKYRNAVLKEKSDSTPESPSEE